ncbi:MAG: fused MFS/spermidine synthase [Flavobacteriales bacterium]|nr:fused MFS/spermidine synthase [Flavobacteriales bacterium]
MSLHKKLLLLAFIEGGSVMALELLGARMAAIFFGNSLYVWTSILSITVGGLAVGYFIGGAISRRYESKMAIYFAFLAAAVATLLMPAWANIVMLETMSTGYQTGVIISCLLFVFPVMAILGTIPPNIINMMTENSSESGTNTGSVYTISTMSGIFATLLIGFYIIPTYGIKSSVYVIASLLAIVPFLFFLKSKIFVALAIMFGFVLYISNAVKKKKSDVQTHVSIVYKTDGLLGQMLVADDLKTEKRSLMINNISQTFMHLPSGRSQWRYVHRMAMYTSMMPVGSNVLLCGIGGGNLINELTILGFNVEAVDLDERMAMVAKRYFRMTDQVTVFEDDARHFIRTTKKKYDIVILDMSAGENQPSNVYTIECFKEIKNMLTDNGVLFLHYQNTLIGEDAIAIKSLGKTLAASGLNPQLLNTNKVQEDGSKSGWEIIGELMLFGSKQPRSLNLEFERRDMFAEPFNFARGENTTIKGYDFNDGMVLTDDQPIMDVFHTSTLETTRGASLTTLLPIFIKSEIDIL